ncbi:MFS transporter [Brooklawnia cerclae]|uniref:ACS family D-galactonate transporter-like MFS transporter n=1 Tax=Brooklawnia cerclae TaxID=349934 RepID=A0ABX0SC57_9ACTN|nr:MFS transporter [Brooklawnia cerclae]NIH55914.1 ACS family D-galactonate transporter-like MFS transporter [Brooklawnia cerclae]
MATFTNYLDRATLAVVGPTLQDEFGMTDVQYGWLSSAFVWGIVAVILVFGALMQRFGERLIGGIGLVGFSLATLLSGTTAGFWPLLGCRLGLGVFEAPTFPMNATLVRRWFPRSERGKAVSTYQFGATAGTAFGIPIIGLIAHQWGWRAGFFAAGAFGLVIALLWFRFVHNSPGSTPRVNSAERALIDADREPEQARRRITREDLRYVLTDRRLLSLYVITGATSTAFFFFMTWLPKYMRDSMGIDVTGGLSSGMKGTIPYIFALAGIVFGGWLSDHLIKRGIPAKVARKWPISIGLIGTSVVFLMPLAHSQTAGLTVISVAYFSASMANCAWVLPAEVSRKEVSALANSTYGFFTNLFGALSPVVAGYLVSSSGYNAMLVYIGAWAVVGLAAILFLLDDVAPTPHGEDLADARA